MGSLWRPDRAGVRTFRRSFTANAIFPNVSEKFEAVIAFCGSGERGEAAGSPVEFS